MGDKCYTYNLSIYCETIRGIGSLLLGVLLLLSTERTAVFRGTAHSMMYTIK